jgi:hypothetical protein
VGAMPHIRRAVEVGETILIKDGSTQRFVRVAQAEPQKQDGTQVVFIVELDMFGRKRPRKVTLGANVHVQ